MSLFDTVGTPALYRTSSAEQHLNLPPPSVSAGNKVSIRSPPESVSTLEFSGIQLSSQANLIKNGDFESVSDDGTPSDWKLTGGNTGVSGENAWRGSHSGSIQIGLGRTPSLVQDFVLSDNSSLPSSCSVFLSAWCLSTQPGTQLEVRVNGILETELDIGRNGAYSNYGIGFHVDPSDTITIYFGNNGTLIGGSAKIDNVFVHVKCS